MRIRYIKQVIGALVLAISVSSCNKWVQVAPEDQLTQKVIFSTKEGYLKALNGVYMSLNNAPLYGRDLSMGMIDVLAQYYNTDVADHQQKPFAAYDYSSESFKNKLDATWSNAYKQIANVNAIIEACDAHDGVLPTNYYNIYKGEALALRAYLHFDLLRLYGPVYASDNQAESIPYMEDSDRAVKPLLAASEVVDRVLNDLKEAESYLRDYDPVRSEGPLNFAGEENNHFNYRQYRFNYFAVKAMLARVSLWKGDKANALKYAEEVIQEAQEENDFFPFVSVNEVRPANANTPSDRMFSKEVLFSLYYQNRVAVYNSYFNPSVNAVSLLTFPGTLTEGRVATLYDNLNDYRRGMWNITTVEDVEVIYNNKFEDISDDDGVSNAFRYMVPLIRISEMYLIRAECSDDFSIALESLNTLRVNRGIHRLELNTREELNKAVEQEYIKEFIGEGQLFFFYKRNAYSELPNPNRVTGGEIPMQIENYVFPLPEGEISQRLND